MENKTLSMNCWRESKSTFDSCIRTKCWFCFIDSIIKFDGAHRNECFINLTFSLFKIDGEKKKVPNERVKERKRRNSMPNRSHPSTKVIRASERCVCLSVAIAYMWRGRFFLRRHLVSLNHLRFHWLVVRSVHLFRLSHFTEFLLVFFFYFARSFGYPETHHRNKTKTQNDREIVEKT